MSAQVTWKGDLTCAFAARDLDKTIAWYRDVLGFELMYRLDMGWCELRSPVENVTLGFSEVEKPEVKGGPTLTFGVEDIDAARKALEAKDVRFDGDTMEIEGMVKLATFFDPDGNKLMFSQTLTEPGG